MGISMSWMRAADLGMSNMPDFDEDGISF